MNDNLVHIKTATGLEINVDPGCANDMELLDACYEVQENNNMLALPKVIRLLLSEEARKALYDHVRKDGRVPYDALIREIVDIMGAVGKANSQQPGPTLVTEQPTEQEQLFPGDAPAYDKSQPPPAGHVDTIMAQLHGALHRIPAQADKLERAARAALEVAKPDTAWELLDRMERELSAADPADSRQSDLVPSSAEADTAMTEEARAALNAQQATDAAIASSITAE